MRLRASFLLAGLLLALAAPRAQVVVYAVADAPPADATPVTLAATHASNNGRPVVVTRTGTGIYSVRFAGLDWPPSDAVPGSGGTFHVTPYSVSNASGRVCLISDWISGPTDLVLTVRCAAPGTTTPSDSPFAVFGTAFASNSLGYLWLDQASQATGTAFPTPPAYSHAPAGGAPSVTRTATGSYTAAFPNLAPATVTDGGHALVSRYGGVAGTRCTVLGWDTDVLVQCANALGAAEDQRFTAAFLRRGFMVSGEAYTWASEPTTPTYSPEALYTHAPRGPVTINRQGTGSYNVHIAGGGSADGHLGGYHVAAYGTPTAACYLRDIQNGVPVPADLTVRVWCDNTSGVALDARFLLLRINNTFLPVSNDGVPEAARLAVGLPAPNPVAGLARVPVTLPAPAEARVEVYDGLGREVAVLHDGPLPAGMTALTLDATGLAPGVYVVRAAAGRDVATQRISVVR